MNDNFLFDNRPPINQNFSDHLFQRLSANYPNKEDKLNTAVYSRKFKWQYALAIFIVTLGLLFTFSAPVRAKASDVLRVISGFIFQKRENSPLKDLDLSKATVYPVETLALAELMKNPPFPFGIPAWVPEGYLLNESVGFSTSWVMLEWSNPNFTSYSLTIQKDYGDLQLAIGGYDTEAITINGQPGYLLRGNWNAEGKWDASLGIEIGWNLDGRFYRLNFRQVDPTTHAIVPLTANMDGILKELKRMAESIKTQN